MFEELYESLKEMYISFSLEEEDIKKKLNLSKNSNDYQFYKDQIKLLGSRISTLSAVLKVFENYNLSKKSNDINNKDFTFKNGYNKEDINRHLQILDFQEKERQRIARDLHDTSLQNLTHLIHEIELSSMYIDKDPIKAKLDLAVVNKNLRSVIQEIRNTVFDLRPMTFDDLGLKESFERLVDKIKESSNISISYYLEEIRCNNSLILMTIFRIVSECINNAIKHSDANNIFFEVKKNDMNSCLINVNDNGKGFDIEEVLSEEDRHFGLCILKERVELLSGIMEIDSKPEKGTDIKIIIPLID